MSSSTDGERERERESTVYTDYVFLGILMADASHATKININKGKSPK